MKKAYVVFGLLISSISLFGTRLARAEEEPTPGVARVSLIHGDVSTQRGDSGDWVAAGLNTPVVPGDKISTGARSRVEIELDYANILRLDQRAQAKLADLTRTHIQIQVAKGTVNFTVLKGTEAEVEVDTPNMAVHPLGEGAYRIQVNSEVETEVTVRKGEAEVSTPQGSTTVEKGHVIQVRGAENPEYQTAKAPARDEWDQWNRERDHTIEAAESWRYANRHYTGAHDLDRNGHWRDVPDYGSVWAPDVGPDWVPYRDGRWVWEPYWGWTWDSYEPWGWAPYHYGRWFLNNDYWAWWPGPIYPAYYPVWAPAYVSFFGFGFGRNFFNFGFGFSSIGWLPLGPFDFFFPWWGFNTGFNIVNITNITNVRNVTSGTAGTGGTYGANPVAPLRSPTGANGVSNVQQALNNARVRRAITTTSPEDFVRGRTPRNPAPVNSATLRQAKAITARVPVVPTGESLRPVNRPVRAGALPAVTKSPEHFFSKRQPPAGPRPFSEQVAEIQQMIKKQNPSGAPSRAGESGRGAVSRPLSGSVQQGATNTGNRVTPSETPVTKREIPLGGQPAGVPEWKRFVQPSKNAPQKAIVGQAASGQVNTLPRSSGGTPQRNEMFSIEPAPQRPGWQRFGAGSSRPILSRPMPSGLPTMQGGPARVFEPTREHKLGSGPMSNHSNWQRLASPSGTAPRETREPSAPNIFQPPRPAPSTRGEQEGVWRQFTPEPRPAPAERGTGFAQPRWESRPAPRSEAWFGTSRQGIQPGSEWRTPTYREAPSSYGRPPLEIRRPIVTERAPRGYDGGGYRGGGNPGGGGNRGGGGGGATYGGGSGGGGRGGSAPSAPSHSGSHPKR